MLEVIRNLYPTKFVITNASYNRCTLNLNTGTNYITNRKYSLLEQFSILEVDSQTFNLTRAKYLLYPYSSN